MLPYKNEAADDYRMLAGIYNRKETRKVSPIGQKDWSKWRDVGQIGYTQKDKQRDERYTFFNELGQMPRNGSRLVLNQGNAPTCAPTSCGMVLNTLGKSVNVHSLINEANVGTNGISISKVATLLKNHDVNATFKNRMTIGDLEVATRNGKPAIVAVKQGGTGHAVVIDGVTNRHGVAVVAIRDPWGKQYFETVESFQKRFLNQGVTIK